MDAHRQKQRIVPLLAVVMALTPAASADLTLIYTASFDLRIPVEPQTGHAWMNDAVINVSDSFTVIDLDVEITLEHTSVFDLQLFVQSPDGTRLTLVYYDPADEFFEGQDYIATIFDDEADASIETGQAPFTGRFRPRAPAELSVFDGCNPQGPWTMQIYDAWYANVGTLEEVKLIFQTPEPAVFLLLLLGIPLARSRKTLTPIPARD